MTLCHRLLVYAALGATGALGGCANMPDQTQTASTQGCKIVLIDSASQEIAAYNSDMHRGRYAPNNQTEQNYADAKVGDSQNKDRRLEFKGTPNAMSDARRGC